MAAKLFPRNSVKFITQICLGPFILIIKHYNWQIERRTVSLLEVLVFSIIRIYFHIHTVRRAHVTI